MEGEEGGLPTTDCEEKYVVGEKMDYCNSKDYYNHHFINTENPGA